MTQIGQFTRATVGFSGHIRTLSVDVEVVIVAIDPTQAENAPDYRLHLGDEDGPEIGAAWKKSSERAGEFLAIIIDDPMLERPIRAILFRADDHGLAWSLRWIRPRKSETET